MTQWGSIERERGRQAVRSGEPDSGKFYRGESRIATRVGHRLSTTPSRDTIPVVDPLTLRFTLASPVVPFTPPLDPLWPPPSPSRATGNVVGASWQYSNHEWGPRVFFSLSLSVFLSLVAGLVQCHRGFRASQSFRRAAHVKHVWTREMIRFRGYRGCSRWDFQVANR